jgi:adenylate cyclase class 2
MTTHETEVKFHIKDLKKIETRLLALKAHLIQPRVHETNFRFDTPDNALRKNQRSLRLRQDDKARFTFKGPSFEKERGVVSREEIEFVVEDFDRARKFLEALGYQAMIFYEKFRAIYELNGLHIMLDELPYGTFIEIEGEDVEAIHSLVVQLELNWDAMIKAGYHALFDRIVVKYGFDRTKLSFEQLKDRHVDLADMQIIAAD